MVRNERKKRREDSCLDRSRAWCGTLNNYTFEEYQALFNDNRFTYILIGKEVCPTTGTRHLQFYCRTENAIRLSTLKNVNRRVHWEAALGNFEENFQYCTKEGAWEERGERPIAGEAARKRAGEVIANKWALARELACSGKTAEIPDDLFIRYYSTFKSIAKDFAKAPDDLPTPPGAGGCGVWLYGPTGTGKSYQARLRYPGAYLKTANNKWWDGYQGQEHVIMDDLDKKHDYMCYHIKIWADRYAFGAETKGSSIIIRPKTIVITSNYHPSEIWDSKSDLEPILRRFTIEHIIGTAYDAERPVDRVSASYAPGFHPVVPDPVVREPMSPMSQSFLSF